MIANTFGDAPLFTIRSQTSRHGVIHRIKSVGIKLQLLNLGLTDNHLIRCLIVRKRLPGIPRETSCACNPLVILDEAGTRSITCFT